MKKFDKIFLLTSSYPYGDGETFIDNEISIIKKFCNELYIVPMVNSYKKKHCGLKEDNIIKIVKIKVLLIDYVIVFIQMFMSLDVWHEIGLLKRNDRLNIYTVLSIIYFFLKGHVRVRNIRRQLKENMGRGENLIYSYWSGTTAYVAAMLRYGYDNCKCVTRAHGYDVYQETLTPYYIPFKQNTFAVIDGVYSVSKCGCEYLKAHFSHLKEKFFISYLGTIDCGLNPNNKGAIFKILTCSNVIAVKRLDRLLEALLKVNSEVEWVHYGDGELMAELKALAQKLPNNIHYDFRGYISNSDLMDIYRHEHIDVFMNVSESEGVPVSIMEACSFGIPVIATDVGGNGEIVKNGYNGYLVSKEGSSNDIARKLKLIIDMTENEIMQMRANSRKLWEDNFDAMKNYEKFYMNMTNEYNSTQ